MAISKCLSLSSENKIPTGCSDSFFQINETGHHGTPDFPAAIYLDDVTDSYVNWHWHEEFEIGFIIEGSVIMGCGNRKYVLKNGDIFFINSNVLHSMHNHNPGENAIFKSIAFNGSIVGGSANSIFYTKYFLPVVNNINLRDYIIKSEDALYQKIIPIVSDVWDGMYKETSDHEILVRNGLSNLFCILTHLQKNTAGNSAQKSCSLLQENRMQTLLGYIHKNYNQKITLEDLAKAASVSKTEILRCFKSIIGQSPINYLKDYRLQRAAYMIANTDHTIGQICEECGFNDNSYFTRSFKERYHCTPHDYRTRK